MKTILYQLLLVLLPTFFSCTPEKTDKQSPDVEATIQKLYTHSLAYHSQNQFEKSDSCLKRILELDSSQTNAYMSLAMSHYYNLKEVEKSLYFLKRALLYEPKNATIYNNLGYFFIKEKQLDSAEYYLKQALLYSPNHDFAISNLGLVYTLKGDMVTAKEYLKRAIKVATSDPYAFKHFAIYYIKNDNIKKACECLEAIDMDTYKMLAPKNEEADVDSLLHLYCTANNSLISEE